ncbi:MAG: hypothetical protein QM630_02240 [Microbacterium sp.]
MTDELLEEGDDWSAVDVLVTADGLVKLTTQTPICRFATLGRLIEGVGVLRAIDHADGVLLGVVIPHEAMGTREGDAS